MTRPHNNILAALEDDELAEKIAHTHFKLEIGEWCNKNYQCLKCLERQNAINAYRYAIFEHIGREKP